MKTISSLSTFKNIFLNAAKEKPHLQVFDDFLTVCISAFTKHPNTGLMCYVKEYLQIAEAYEESNTFDDLMKLPAELFNYIKQHKDNPDMLGEFYSHLFPNSERLHLPFHLCFGMTKAFSEEAVRPVCVFDTSVGSGRMLISFECNSAIKHRYYGVDNDPLFVKMAALNLFLCDMPGEVICADNFDPDNFKFGYRVVLAPSGIFKVDNKEKSQVWLMNRDVWANIRKANPEKRLLFF